MSPACQLEMTLPGGIPGGVRGDYSADERWGADAARGVAGFGPAAADDRGGRATAGAWASSGFPAVEGIPYRGCGWPNFEAAWLPEQPAQARGAPHEGAGAHLRAVLGLWPEPGGGKAGWGPWDSARSRDAAAMDDRSRVMARSQAAAKARPPAAPSPRVRWRTRASRRLRALVVRGPRPAMHTACLRRRCDQPADAPPIC
jgi:hypothetical protein